jgi:hypothetical protein
VRKCLTCEDREELPSGRACPVCRAGGAAAGQAGQAALFDGEALEAAGDLRDEGAGIVLFPKEDPNV